MSHCPHNVWGMKTQHWWTCTTTQPTTTSTSHHIGMYAPQTNMPTKLQIYTMYAKRMKSIYRRCISIYVPHMKSLPSSMWPGRMYTENDDTTNNTMSTASYWSFMWKTSVMPYMKASANKKSQIWMMDQWQRGQSCFTMCRLNLKL